MRLVYGSFQHASAETTVQIEASSEFNEGGEIQLTRYHWTVTGFLQASNQQGISTAILNLQKAYSIQGQNLALLDDAGNITPHNVQSKNTLGGVRVVRQPSFPQGTGAEYSTFRYYTIELEYVIPNPQIPLIRFRERLTFTGTGGATFAFMPTLQGAPPKQLLREVSTVHAVQEGEAVGWLVPTVPMPPLFALSEHVERRVISYESPKRYGPYGPPTYAEYPVSWHYEFEDLLLIGAPNRWIT